MKENEIIDLLKTAKVSPSSEWSSSVLYTIRGLEKDSSIVRLFYILNWKLNLIIFLIFLSILGGFIHNHYYKEISINSNYITGDEKDEILKKMYEANKNPYSSENDTNADDEILYKKLTIKSEKGPMYDKCLNFGVTPTDMVLNAGSFKQPAAALEQVQLWKGDKEYHEKLTYYSFDESIDSQNIIHRNSVNEESIKYNGGEFAISQTPIGSSSNFIDDGTPKDFSPKNYTNWNLEDHISNIEDTFSDTEVRLKEDDNSYIIEYFTDLPCYTKSEEYPYDYEFYSKHYLDVWGQFVTKTKEPVFVKEIFSKDGFKFTTAEMYLGYDFKKTLIRRSQFKYEMKDSGDFMTEFELPANIEERKYYPDYLSAYPQADEVLQFIVDENVSIPYYPNLEFGSHIFAYDLFNLEPKDNFERAFYKKGIEGDEEYKYVMLTKESSEISNPILNITYGPKGLNEGSDPAEFEKTIDWYVYSNKKNLKELIDPGLNYPDSFSKSEEITISFKNSFLPAKFVTSCRPSCKNDWCRPVSYSIVVEYGKYYYIADFLERGEKKLEFVKNLQVDFADPSTEDGLRNITELIAEDYLSLAL